MPSNYNHMTWLKPEERAFFENIDANAALVLGARPAAKSAKPVAVSAAAHNKVVPSGFPTHVDRKGAATYPAGTTFTPRVADPEPDDFEEFVRTARD
jgi:hypothetical protein